MATMKQKLDRFGTKARRDLIALADSQNKEFPQMVGAFDSHVVVQMNLTIKSKGMVVGTKGEMLLAKPETEVLGNQPGNKNTYVSVYSPHKGWHCLIKATDVQVVGAI